MENTVPNRNNYLFHVTIKNERLFGMLEKFYDASNRLFEKERKPKDPSLKRYEVSERILERGLNHPDTVSEVKELIAAGFLPPDGLN
jgi:hypothetical protein